MILIVRSYSPSSNFGGIRARVHRRLSTSFRQILLHTALKILAIRKYACKFCLVCKKFARNPHIFPTNTSSKKRDSDSRITKIKKEFDNHGYFSSVCGALSGAFHSVCSCVSSICRGIGGALGGTFLGGAISSFIGKIGLALPGPNIAAAILLVVGVVCKLPNRSE